MRPFILCAVYYNEKIKTKGNSKWKTKIHQAAAAIQIIRAVRAQNVNANHAVPAVTVHVAVVRAVAVNRRKLKRLLYIYFGG